VRIWIDMTASAHVLVFRPVIDLLRERGHEVAVTARDYGQTLGLLEMHGIGHRTFGAHAGESRLRKGLALAQRTGALARFARRERFDLALAHGSNDLALAAGLLRIPAVNMFDYEFAIQQHNIGCRLARRVVVPDRIPPERLKRFGVGPGKLVQYPGLKEEYYLADFEPDPSVLDTLGVDPERVVAVFRPPPEVSMYHRDNPLFADLLRRVGNDEGVHAVVLPRVEQQREQILAMGLPSVIVPRDAVDAQSLIALADLVVSAGGTMNREAVALGTPVYTIFRGVLGAVDEALIAEGRMRPVDDPAAVELRKKDREGGGERRDPNYLVDVFLGTTELT
jgi:predicted glycosyltransferase